MCYLDVGLDLLSSIEGHLVLILFVIGQYSVLTVTMIPFTLFILLLH